MSSSKLLDIKNYIGLTGDTPIRFIASDVDGTLVNDAKSVDPEVVAAVRAARESGIRVAIASGRAWHEMDDIIDAMPCLRYFVCTNGAYVMDKEEQKELVHISFDKTRAVDLVRKLMTYGVFVEAYVKAEIFGQYPVVGNETAQAEHFFRPNIRPFILKTRTMVPDLIAHLESLPEGPEKIQIFYGDEAISKRILADLRDEFQGAATDGKGRERFYDVLESSEGNLEFVLPHTTKGTAVEALANHWGYTPDEVMTIGDSENDLEMLELAGYSFAMENGEEKVKRMAKYIAPSNGEAGVLQVLEQYLKER